jgi:N-acyl-D-amino-acid deacylase
VSAATYDVIVRGALVADGSGLEPYRADVGIQAGRIQCVGNLKEAAAKQTLPAEGGLVMPGFIDVHAHSDLMALVSPSYEEKVRQGVTFELIGNCGLSMAPVTNASLPILQDALLGLFGLDSPAAVDWRWHTYGEFLDAIDAARPALNVGGLVGHSALRAQVMGVAARPASKQESLEMARALERSLVEGAIGFSSGTYLAAGLADMHELTTLTHVVAEHGKVFTYHMPNQALGLVDSGRFATEIGSRTEVAVHIAHIKSSGRNSWPLMNEFLRVLRQARSNGLKITGDLYPYAAGSSAAWSLFPPRFLEGGVVAFLGRLKQPRVREELMGLFDTGKELRLDVANQIGWENTYVTAVNSSANKQYEGQSFAAVAARRRTSPIEALMDLLLEEHGHVNVMAFDGAEEHIEQVLREPGIMIGSDGVYGGRPHPRLYGTFPRILAVYVRERGIWSWGECAYRMSALPALTLGLTNRGFVRPGMWADLVVLDPHKVNDTATYTNPRAFPSGIGAVLVNGTLVWDGQQKVEQRPGKVIRNAGPAVSRQWL